MFYRMLILLLISTNALAEISIQGPTPTSGFNFTFLDTADTNVIRRKVITPGSIFLNTQYGYINKPLVAREGNQSQKLVTGLQSLDLRSGILVSEKTDLSINLSLNSLTIPKEGSQFAVGDSVAQLKYRLSDIKDEYQAALIPQLYLPFGSKANYLSSGEVGGALKLALTKQYQKFKLGTNIGYRYLPNATLQNLDYQNHVIAGIAAEIGITEKLFASIEGIGFMSLPYKESNSTGEMYFGALYSFSPLSVLTAGVSLSGLGATGNQSFRGIAGFKKYFDEEPKRKVMVTIPPACFVEPFTSTFHSRPLDMEEQKRLYGLLPYKSNHPVTHSGFTVEMRTLRYGEMTGVKGEDFPIVKDGQIPFAIDLTHIPDLKSIKEINHAWLKMKVNKLSQDNFLGTEILCSLNFGICSGSPLKEDKYGPLFNSRFFNGKKRVFNDRFSRLYLDKPIAAIEGEKLYSKMLTFPLQDLAYGSDIQVKHFFQKAKNGKKTLYFVIADDTFLSNEVSLEVSMGVERCYRKR